MLIPRNDGLGELDEVGMRPLIESAVTSHGTEAEEGDEDEADGRQPERHADPAGVDDDALKLGEHRAADDGHDEEGGADLGFLFFHVGKSDAIDGRKHERHTGRNHDEADETGVGGEFLAEEADGENIPLKIDRADGEEDASQSEAEQHAARAEDAEQEGADPAAGEEDDHGDDVP